jgi:uncharacterized protein YndB with AHSA1/START domain
MTTTDLTVRKTITVNADPERAFEVFTAGHGGWWPASYHIGEAGYETAVIEPFEGGRWFERGVDGSECDWGRVLAWEPPSRLVLSWQISAKWAYDPDLVTELEIRFEPEGTGQTRVELEHRHLDRMGDQAESMRATFESEQGWGGILDRYAAEVSR